MTVEESGSVAGQVLLLGGRTDDQGVMPTVHLVDLATGVCTRQPNLFIARGMFAAVRLHQGASSAREDLMAITRHRCRQRY